MPEGKLPSRIDQQDPDKNRHPGGSGRPAHDWRSSDGDGDDDDFDFDDDDSDDDDDDLDLATMTTMTISIRAASTVSLEGSSTRTGWRPDPRHPSAQMKEWLHAALLARCPTSSAPSRRSTARASASGRARDWPHNLTHQSSLVNKSSVNQLKVQHKWTRSNAASARTGAVLGRFAFALRRSLLP